MARTDSNWIQTFTGRQFWPTDPRAEDVDIEDICHALALKCRFTGHCRRFYSVAQHSVIVSRLVPPADALAGLLHDATEAYMPDVARPLKAELPGLREMEDGIWRAISVAFGLNPVLPATVKQADLVALATERRDLMAYPPRPWKTDELAKSRPERICPLSPIVAAEEFAMRYLELTGTEIGL